MILPFHAPPPVPLAAFRLSVTLRKGSQTWSFEIRPMQGIPEAQTWVRLDGRPHRAHYVRSYTEAERVQAEYLREIAWLEQDGWERV